MQLRQAMLVTPGSYNTESLYNGVVVKRSRCNTGRQDRGPFGDEAIDDLLQLRTVLLVLSPPGGQR